MLISDQWVIEEIKEEIKKKIPRDKWKPHNDPKPIGHRKGSSKKEVYSNTILPQETRKMLNRQPNFTSETTGERRRTTTTKIAKEKKS